MASTAEYLQQATHNLELATYLRVNKDDCLDWAVTCLFYAAIHYVNAYLTKKGKAIPRRHRGTDPHGTPGRLNIVQQDPALRNIYSSYRHLDDESRDARYELKKLTPQDYDHFLFKEMQKIKSYIIPKVVA